MDNKIKLLDINLSIVRFAKLEKSTATRMDLDVCPRPVPLALCIYACVPACVFVGRTPNNRLYVPLSGHNNAGGLG